MFIDTAKIFCKAGKGGDGSISFRREKYVPNGGPDGGDGGNGGSIIVVGDKNIRTLADFKYKTKYKAENGENGRGRNQFGKYGVDLILKIPLGTLIKDQETNGVIYDMKVDGDRFVVAKGGRGGKGNAKYASSIKQAPRYAQPGEEGIERDIVLELKLIADVGLIGFPNVGKSTLLSVVSNANPKIANYHFTTLSPNLGVVKLDEEISFVVADIPGLIEGASQGLGLGLDFLKHTERTRMFAHVIDASGSEGRDPVKDFYDIEEELLSYNIKMKDKKRVIIANKMDLPDSNLNINKIKEGLKNENLEIFEVSGVTQAGIKELLYGLWNIVKDNTDDFYSTYDEAYIKEEKEIKEFVVRKENDDFIVEGPFAEKLLYRTNFEVYESAMYFQTMLEKKGINDELINLGIKEGDTVIFAGFELEYSL